jgi:putative tryptophan/tyrosine transport system substrate-binding protein
MVTPRRLLLIGGIGLITAHPSRAQSASVIHRAGVLLTSSEATSAHLLAAFSQAMRDLGWVEGTNIEYRIVSAGGDVDRLGALANELIRQNVELIVAASTAGTRAAQRATKTIPVVMVNASNALDAGFVASLAKPGGNITGVSNQREEALQKLIEILHEVLPDARRIGILLNERNPSYRVLSAAAQTACSALNLLALPVVASVREQLAGAIGEIARQQSQAVIVVPDPVYLNERTMLQKLMQATRLPAAYGLREHVFAGGLLSYAADLAGNYRLAARYVDRLLKGAKPADLPVEQPTKYEFVVNLKTAHALGITIPPSVLLRADEVIQ